MGDELFEEPMTIAQFLDEWRGKALAYLAALPSDLLLRGNETDDLEAELVERWRVKPLALEWDAMTSEASEVDVPHGTQHGEVTGTKVTLFVPFSGAAGLFHMRPSRHPENPPHGTVRGGETLLLDYSYIEADPATVKRELDHQVEAVKECVSSINSDVDAFNADLSGLFRGALKARLDKLQADADVVAAIGVPLRQRSTVKRDEVKPAPRATGRE